MTQINCRRFIHQHVHRAQSNHKLEHHCEMNTFILFSLFPRSTTTQKTVQNHMNLPRMFVCVDSSIQKWPSQWGSGKVRVCLRRNGYKRTILLGFSLSSLDWTTTTTMMTSLGHNIVVSVCILQCTSQSVSQPARLCKSKITRSLSSLHCACSPSPLPP